MHYADDLSSELTSSAINNLANAGGGMFAGGLGALAANMNIIDNRPPPPPHSNLLHMAGKFLLILTNKFILDVIFFFFWAFFGDFSISFSLITSNFFIFSCCSFWDHQVECNFASKLFELTK